jgi:hypothetical protein
MVPQQSDGRVVVNAATQRWDVPIDEAVRPRDMGNGVVPVERMGGPVELLTLTLESASASEAAARDPVESSRS